MRKTQLAPTHHPTSKRRGFTLIELLVVISIIALLISILLPALKQARQHARMIACLANLRSTGISLQLYADTENRYPKFRENYTSGNSWAYTLDRDMYAAVEQFSCPESEFEWKVGAWKGISISYGYNAYFIGSNYWPFLSTAKAGQWGIPAASVEIDIPSQTIFVTDTARIPNTEYGTFALYPKFVVGRKDGAFARHGNETQINVLWGDGRATSTATKQNVRAPYPNPYPELGPDLNAPDTWWDRK